MPNPSAAEQGGTGRNDGQTSYDPTVSYVVGTTGNRLNHIGVDPRAIGAPANGVDDDSSYIAAAAFYSPTIDLRNGTWRIEHTVSLSSNTTLLMDSASIALATGASAPGFQFINAASGLTIYHGGGQVTGTASCFLFAQGSTNTPTSFAHYASLINIYNLRINSATITSALVFDKAVNTVNLYSPNFFCPNGLDISGKCVDITITNHTIFSATGIAGTFGIRTRSTGGTIYYNEGLSLVNGTIDNFETSLDISDIFDFQVTGGYIGTNGTLSATTGYAFKFQAPSNTNLTDVITIGGGAVINGRTIFVASAAGQAYNATIDASWTGTPGTAVTVENNACNIAITGKFKAGTGTAIAVVGNGNNNKLITDVEVDSTYTSGAITNGSLGTDCYIDACGPCSGDIVGSARSNIRYGSKVPIHSAGVVGLMRTVSAANLGAGATYAVGVNIATTAWGFARGEKGFIEVRLPYSGANAATQNLQIAVPAGVVLDSGTGWSASNLYLGAAAGRLSELVPYTCAADGSGNITVANQAGNTLTVTNQAYCGIRRNW